MRLTECQDINVLIQQIPRIPQKQIHKKGKMIFTQPNTIIERKRRLTVNV